MFHAKSLLGFMLNLLQMCHAKSYYHAKSLLSLLMFLLFDHNAPILADQVHKLPGLSLFRQ